MAIISHFLLHISLILFPSPGWWAVFIIATHVAILPHVESVLLGNLLLFLQDLDGLFGLREPSRPFHARQAIPHHLEGNVLVGLRVADGHLEDRLWLPSLHHLADAVLHLSRQDLAPSNKTLETLCGLVPKVVLKTRGLHESELARKGQGTRRLQVESNRRDVLLRRHLPVSKVDVEHGVGLLLPVVRFDLRPVHLPVPGILAKDDLADLELAPRRIGKGERADLLQEGVRAVIDPLGVKEAPADDVDCPDLDNLDLLGGLRSSSTSTSLPSRVLLGGLLVVLPHVELGVPRPVLGRHQGGAGRHAVALDGGQAGRKKRLSKVDPLGLQVEPSRERSHPVDVDDLDLDVSLHAVEPGVLHGLLGIRGSLPRAPHVTERKGDVQRVLRDVQLEPVARQHVVHEGVHPIRPLEEGQELLGLGLAAARAQVVDSSRGRRLLPAMETLPGFQRLALGLHEVLVDRAPVVV
mmetsp:Transcript_1939/g.6326  ORF Transcript_1939/g.6326 Transcript_1939/m.6326 type:complete len:466 (-) Transcript_1939:1844-3241(-)